MFADLIPRERATDPSPVPRRLVKAPSRDTLSPRERAVDINLHAHRNTLKGGLRGVHGRRKLEFRALLV